MKNKYILLWLEAPLQSWGFDSKFGRRDTLPFPTRSGILGLLFCAMGASGEQRELLAQLKPFGQTVISYNRWIQKGDNELVRKEREPLLKDFHMVGSGYNEQDIWENNHIPKTSNGKKAVGGGAKMTFRYYLQDAVFAVIMEIPYELEDDFTTALKNPVYDIYLGRKNCVPTEFIYQGCFDTEEAAIKHTMEIANEKNLIEDFRVLEGEHEGELVTLNDVPIQFGQIKRYQDRRVTIVYS